MDSANILQIESRKTPEGYLVIVGQGAARAVIEPLVLEAPDGNIQGRWTAVTRQEEAVTASGRVDHPGGHVIFSLDVAPPAAQGAAPLVLNWRILFEQGSFTGALVHPITLLGAAQPGVDLDAALDLPSIRYGTNLYGTGLFPRPRVEAGFAFRADRLAQPALHFSLPSATWSYFAARECPDPHEAEFVYSLGVTPPNQGDLTLFFRYPQREYGHKGDGSDQAYIGKSTFGPGEHLVSTWRHDDFLRKTLFLWLRGPEAAHDYASPARFLWSRAYPQVEATPVDLWQQGGEHIRWFNARLYKKDVGGGQYESPEGSGTAMLGFVEQSLRMAATTLHYVVLARSAGAGGAELDRREEQAAGALTRWATEGLSPEGLLFPACDRASYFFGYRDYSDYENLTIVRDGSFDTIRLAGESRSLLAAARVALLYGRQDPEPWVRAALSVAGWFLEHPLSEGGYAPRYDHGGEPLESYPSGTASVLSLFCECARWLRASSPDMSRTYAEHARNAYAQALAPLVRQGAFSGGTLDASCPDREAAIAALGACLQLYNLTGEEVYLQDAGYAAANILSYTLVYPISTFCVETDASRRHISTFGASIVSPENQHLDPVSSAPGLLLYGLYSGDTVMAQVAAESLKWCLDGRWAVKEDEGLKQSEQLLHTRWYYNTFFSRRGDFRRGMPVFGMSDSEHGWPQVVPTADLLGAGQVIVDWQTGQAMGLDAWTVEAPEKEQAGSMSLTATTPLEDSRSLLLKVVRLPESPGVILQANGRSIPVSSEQLAFGYLLALDGPPPVEITLRTTNH